MEERAQRASIATMSDIYHALLKSAANHGYPRATWETANEFCLRLIQQFPFIEAQLTVITDAFAMTRYGGTEPDEHEIAYMQNVWAEVEQRWRNIPEM